MDGHRLPSGEDSITIRDAYSGYGQARRTRSEGDAAEVLLDFINHYGRPVILVTDNGGAFGSRKFLEVVNLYGIVHRTT